MRSFLNILLLIVCLSAPSPAIAQTLSAALQRAFDSDDAGLRLLRSNGGRLGPVLTMERLPSGEVLVEVQVTLDGRLVRYPLKLTRAEDDWSLAWQPAGVYASALIGMAKSGALPDVATTERWVDVARMPALPIIATRKRFVTPFGEVAVDDHGDAPAQGDLEMSPGLLRAGKAWVSMVLDDDPGPAGIDLILDDALTWRQTNKLLFNAASVGFFEVTVVTRDMGALRVASPARQARFVVALSPLEAGFGVRVVADGEIVAGDGCAENTTACVSEPSDLVALLKRVPPGRGPWMFAATGDVSTRDVVAFAAQFAASAEAPAHRLLVGFVQK